MELFLCVIIIGGILLILGAISDSLDQKAAADKKRKKVIDEFGEPTLEIEGNANEPTVYIYESDEVILIGKEKVLFSDIIDFQLNNEKSYRTSTSAMGTIGRGILGATLFGGVGAVVGGTTAKKNTKTHTVKYTVYITVDDLAKPVIEYTSTNEKCVQQLMSALKIIIDRKHSV